MPNDTQQPKSYVQRFDDLMSEMLENAVTRGEVRQVLDVMIAKYKELSALIDQKTAETKAEMRTETARIGREVAELEKRFRELVDTSRREQGGSLDMTKNELLAEIGYVESLIERYDDSELRQLIKETRNAIPQVPEAFDASYIHERLDTLGDMIDELRKRPAARGGGHTDMGVKFSLGRIVKTETPTGDIDGNNKEFTTTQPIHAVLSYMLNGEVVGSTNYTIANNKITWTTAPPAAYSGKDHEIVYV